jgi:hypothetical protein
VSGDVDTLELSRIILNELRQIQKLEIPQRAQRTHVKFIFDGHAALVDAHLQILRRVENWETGESKR